MGKEGGAYEGRVFVEAANGVGGGKAETLARRLDGLLTLELRNTGEGKLNHQVKSPLSILNIYLALI